MVIIGEKINGTLKRVSKAIIERDAKFISHLVEVQVKAGVSFLDVNAGGSMPDQEDEAISWLIKVIQENYDVPLCIDSANAKTLARVLPLLKRKGIVNSVNGMEENLNLLLPLVKKHNCAIVALLMDEKGVPETAAERAVLASRIIRKARMVGVRDEEIYFDAVIQTVASSPHAGGIFLDTLKLLHQEFPKAMTIMGLSNISFGLPARKIINRAFIALGAAAGVDAFIIDPLDKDLIAIAKAARLLAGIDPYARDYLSAYRSGLIKMQKDRTTFVIASPWFIVTQNQ